MAKKIRDIGEKFKRIRDIGEHYPPVDPSTIAAALGGELVGTRQKGGSPLAVFAARQALARRLSSAPAALVATNGAQRVDILLSEKDWCQLQHLVAALENDEVRPTVGQVVGALLKLSLIAADPGLIRQELQRQATTNGASTKTSPESTIR
jgi:hypothetical protein